MRTLTGQAVLLLAATGIGLCACNKADEALTKRLLESNDKVLACQKDLAHAKDEVAGLKRQVAQAIANPSRIQLQDPEIIKLVADIRGIGGPAEVGTGGLDPRRRRARS